MTYCILGLLLGCQIIWLLPPYSVQTFAYLFGMVIIIGGLAYRWVAPHRRLALVLFGAILGGVLQLGHVAVRAANHLPSTVFYHTYTLLGQITALAYQTPRASRFTFSVTSPGVWHKQQLMVYWYGQLPSLARGQVWRLALHVRPVHAYANPGLYDKERTAWRAGIVAIATVDAAHAATRVNVSAAPSFWQRLSKALGQSQAAAIAQALLTGNKQAVSHDTQRLFQQTGTAHLLAISGLHVGFVGLVIGILFSSVSYLRPSLLQVIPRPTLRAAIGLVAASVYASFSGFATPALRAILMLGFWVVNWCRGYSQALLASFFLVWRLFYCMILSWCSMMAFGYLFQQ